MKKDIKLRKYDQGIFDFYKANIFHIEKWDSFAEIMWGLGYEVDAYKSYKELYPKRLKWNMPAREKYDIVLENLEKSDRYVVGNYILTKYKYLTSKRKINNPVDEAYFFSKAFYILEQKYSEERK